MSNLALRIMTGLVLLVLLSILLFVLPASWVLGSFVMLGVLAFHELFMMYKRGSNNRKLHDVFTLAVMGYSMCLVSAMVALWLLYQKNSWLAAAMFAIVMGMDVGGYFAGKAWGKTKLCPSISPGKTVEGVLGGILLVCIGTCVVLGQKALPWLSTLALVLSTAAFAVIGDLLESWIKRMADVKDSGSLLPGHGGVLDRIDSMILAAPAFYLGIQVLYG